MKVDPMFLIALIDSYPFSSNYTPKGSSSTPSGIIKSYIKWDGRTSNYAKCKKSLRIYLEYPGILTSIRQRIVREDMLLRTPQRKEIKVELNWIMQK